MGIETSVALMAGSLALAAVGTGVGVYSSFEAAGNERAMADYNAQIAQQQADIQGKVAQRQAEMAQYNATLQMRQGEAQQQAAEYNAQLQERNATTMRAYADNAEAQGTEQARRMRLEKLRIMGGLQSQYAAAGVTTEGSPLAVLAETDGMLELQIQDGWYQTVQQTKNQRGQADLLDWQANVTRQSGDYSNLLTQSSAQLDLQNAQFEAQTASAGTRIAQRQADINQMAGNNRADAYMWQGAATGLQGAASMSDTLLKYDYNRPSNNIGKTKPGGPYNPYASVRTAIAIS